MWPFNLRRKVAAVDSTQRQEESPVDFCSRLVKAFEEKADHNKNESIANFVLVTVATLLAPLFITLGTGFWAGKVVPSVLSLSAAGSTGWLQLRQPQRLWSIYRTAQRELEDHRTKHQYGIGEYEDSERPDKLLAKNTAEIALSVHYKWLPLVPSPENLQGLQAQGSAAGQTNQMLAQPLSDTQNNSDD